VTYVLDTNVVSGLMRGDEPCVRGFAAADPNDVFVPHPVVAEIRYGLARLPRSRRRTTLVARADALFAAIRRAQWTDDVSDHFGATKADLERRGVRLEDMDVIIAAHALAMSATLVTRNVRQLARVRGLVIDTWT
jgi:tRNA(fMet)-specific endonuclease VapC